jgi:glucosaminylphosphatidylinositol acyltransferase
MLITCIAILAVDFHAFPRRFAKAEAFGTGLMDAGVGSIVVATAFACGMKEAAAASAVSNTAGASSSSISNSNYISSRERRIRRDIYRLIALAALGLSRPLLTSALNYQRHVGEYGMHWNFFLTLAALRGLTLFVPRVAQGSAVTCGLLGTVVLATHQWLLSSRNFTEYIHLESYRKSDLISANKEGIFSLPGYFALHLLGCAVGAVLEETAGPSRVQLRAGQRRRVAGIVIAIWVAFFAVSTCIQPVSRRACNAAYVLWMLGLNAQSLALLASASAALPTQPLPGLLQAINDSMLPTFLVANVLTGVVNMSIDTMHVGDWGARIIVLIYMAVICLEGYLHSNSWGEAAVVLEGIIVAMVVHCLGR